MSESAVEPVDLTIEHPDSGIPSGAGAMLRAAREAQGLHIAMLAVSLKVPVKKLEALEAERYDLLPDTVFVRALASSVCRALGIDAAPVLATLPRSDVPRIKSSVAGLNTTFNDASRGSGRRLLSHFGKPLGLAMVLLVLGIFAVVFLPAGTSSERVLAMLPGGNSSLPPIASVPLESEPLPAVTSSLQVSEVLPPLVVINSADMPVRAAGQASPPVLNALASTPALPLDVVSGAHTGEVLSLRALGASWVEVVDAKGVLQLRKTLLKDEVVPVTGALPLVVVLGRADLVAVTVRGQPFDAISIAKDNVARFEVK